MSDRAADLYYDACHAMQQADFENAFMLFKASAELEEHFKTYTRLYEVCVRMNRLEEAKGFIRLAYDLNPRNDKTAFLYATCLLNLKFEDEAKAVLEALLARNNSYKPAKTLLDQIKE